MTRKSAMGKTKLRKKHVVSYSETNSLSELQRKFDIRKRTLVGKAQELEISCNVAVAIIIETKEDFNNLTYYYAKKPIEEKLLSIGILRKNSFDLAGLLYPENELTKSNQNADDEFVHSEDASSAPDVDETPPADHRPSPQNSIERQHLMGRLQSKPLKSKSNISVQVNESRADTTDVNQPSSSPNVNRQNVTRKNKASTSKPQTATFEKRISSNSKSSEVGDRTPASTAFKNTASKVSGETSRHISRKPQKTLYDRRKNNHDVMSSSAESVVRKRSASANIKINLLFREAACSAASSSTTSTTTKKDKQEESSSYSSSSNEKESDRKSHSKSKNSSSSNESSGECFSSNSEKEQPNLLRIEQVKLPELPCVADDRASQEDLVYKTSNNVNHFSVSWPPEEVEMDHAGVPQGSASAPISTTNVADDGASAITTETGLNDHLKIPDKDPFGQPFVCPKSSCLPLTSANFLRDTALTNTGASTDYSFYDSAVHRHRSQDDKFNFAAVEDFYNSGGLSGSQYPAKVGSEQNNEPKLCKMNDGNSQLNQTCIKNVSGLNEAVNADASNISLKSKNFVTDSQSGKTSTSETYFGNTFAFDYLFVSPRVSIASSGLFTPEDQKPTLFMESPSQSLDPCENSLAMESKKLLRNQKVSCSDYQACIEEEKSTPRMSAPHCKSEKVTFDNKVTDQINNEHHLHEFSGNKFEDFVSLKQADKENKHATEHRNVTYGRSNAGCGFSYQIRALVASNRAGENIQPKNSKCCSTSTKNLITRKRSCQTPSRSNQSKQKRIQGAPKTPSISPPNPAKQPVLSAANERSGRENSRRSAESPPFDNRNSSYALKKNKTASSPKQSTHCSASENQKLNSQNKNAKETARKSDMISQFEWAKNVFEDALSESFLQANPTFKRRADSFMKMRQHIPVCSLLESHKHFHNLKRFIDRRFTTNHSKDQFLFDSLRDSKKFLVEKNEDSGRLCMKRRIDDFLVS